SFRSRACITRGGTARPVSACSTIAGSQSRPRGGSTVSGASRTSTSTRITATASSMRSRKTRTCSSRTCTRTGVSSTRAPAAAPRPGADRRRARSSISRCLPAPTTTHSSRRRTRSRRISTTRNPSSCCSSAARIRSAATRSRIFATPRKPTRTPRGACVRSPSATRAGVCSRWAEAATTGAISRARGRASSTRSRARPTASAWARKIVSDTFSATLPRGVADPALFAALHAEARRQEEHIELIASENYVSAAVLAAQGSVLTNKYADGYPGRRTYRGCEHVDAVEALAIERARRLFGVRYATLQPYSGSQANMAAYLALLEPGDTVLAMRPDHGGHRTHGDAANFSGKLYRIEHYGVDPETGLIDYDAVRVAARRVRPKLIVAGYSAYPRVVDWSEFRRIADEVGARLLADMAHVAGLVAADLHPSPVGIADVITTTTHKTLRGPRGGMILADDATLGRRLDAAVFPGVQGGPLMHVVAAKAVALHE